MIELTNPALVTIPPQYDRIFQILVPDRGELRYGLWSDRQTTEVEPDLYV